MHYFLRHCNINIPMDTKSSTDSEDPRRASPYNDSDEPMRANDRSETDEPENAV